MSTTRLLNLLIVFFLLAAGYFLVVDHCTPDRPSLRSNLATAAGAPEPMCLDNKQQGLKMWCIGDSVRIRSSAEINDYNVIPNRRLMKGEAVFLLAKSCSLCAIKGMKGYWHQIRFDGGQEGWVFFYLSEKRPLPPSPPLPQSEQSVRELGWLERFRNYTGIMQSAPEKELYTLVEACDFVNPIVRNTAVKEAAGKNAENAGEINLGQVANLYDFAAKNWAYIDDPGSQEYVAKASESILNGRKGDCDDFAVLMFSLVSAIGGDSRINYAYNSNSGHAFAEVKVGASIVKTKEYLSIRYGCAAQSLAGFRKDKTGIWWMNLDWFDRPQHPAGQYFNWQSGLSFYIDQRNLEAFDQ